LNNAANVVKKAIRFTARSSVELNLCFYYECLSNFISYTFGA